MNMNQEQIDFFSILRWNVDWRGVVYDKAKSDSEAVSGIKEGQSEVETQAEVTK